MSEQRGWDQLSVATGAARAVALAATWRREAEALAPEDDWGESIGDTCWADALRSCADRLIAAFTPEDLP